MEIYDPRMGKQETGRKFLFIVQGEGRGHLTQAITLCEMLMRHGCQVTRILVGCSSRRQIPDYFLRETRPVPVMEFSSPNFVTGRHNRRVHIWRTIGHSLQKLPVFLRALHKINTAVKQDQPDVIINFYDFLGGFYNRIFRPDGRMVCIGHQYLARHRYFPFAKGNLADKHLFKLGNYLTSMGAEKILALSFNDRYKSNGHIQVVPPLLRREVFDLQPESRNFILTYMVNDGYYNDLVSFNRSFPETMVHCFWDRKDVDKTHQVSENLIFHQLDDNLFLRMLAGCSAYACTAGFESVCEAMLLGKPVLMVPVAGHYEQACNALDGVRAGAGIYADSFLLDKLEDSLEKSWEPTEVRAWFTSAEKIILRELTEL